MTKKETLPIHKYFGNTSDYFYQIGLKDRERHKMLLSHTKKILSGNLTIGRDATMNLVTKAIGFLSEKSDLNEVFQSWCKDYAHGLDADKDDILFAFLLPDLLCSLGGWMPGIPYYILGCSSIFSWCDKRDTLVHGRILDFPFGGSFDVNERGLLTSLDDGPHVFSIGSAGLPFPVTAMSEHGFTLALHQIFTTQFHPKNTPIFEIIHTILNECTSKEEILSYLETVQSISTWGIYCGFKNGEVLALNLLGDEFTYDEYTIGSGDILYFNNMLLEENSSQEFAKPYGAKEFCEMRELAFQKKCDQHNIGDSLVAEDILKLMGTPLNFKKNDKWLCDFTTITSLHSVCLIPERQECLHIPGLAPKLLANKMVSITNCFSACDVQEMKIRTRKIDQNYQNGLFHLQQAQIFHDQKEVHLAYHHVQMAVHYFKGHAYHDIALFYLCVFQYIYDQGLKHLSRLLKTLRDLLESKHLTPYLKDHCKLFIARLEKIRGGATSISIEEVHHLALQRVFEFEQNMPSLLFHQTTRSFMSARIDMIDIIYPHVKVST